MVLTEARSRNDGRADGADARIYPLGHSARELARLEAQGGFLGDLTEDLLRRAGVAPGMRVLDIGCGVGDVSLLAGAMVGAAGAVVGIDRSLEAVAIASRRAAAAGLHRLCFAVADIDTFAVERAFDAVVGRLVLMYLPDPAASLRRLRRVLRPGGLVAVQEMSMPLARSVPEGPLFRRCTGWFIETFARAGFDFDMGSRLFGTFVAAGLPAPRMIVAGRAEGGAHSPVYDYVAGALRSLVPTMERLGVATAAEIDVDTVAERLREEAVACNACVLPPPLVGAWARMPV